MYFWQKPEGVILDDEYLGGTKKPISLLFVLRKNGFCIFRQFWEIWATNEKKIFEIFLNPFFCPKSEVEKIFLTPFLG